jgi:hypothetical protein
VFPLLGKKQAAASSTLATGTTGIADNTAMMGTGETALVTRKPNKKRLARVGESIAPKTMFLHNKGLTNPDLIDQVKVIYGPNKLFHCIIISRDLSVSVNVCIIFISIDNTIFDKTCV